MGGSFPHLDSAGNAHMVDITGKEPSSRRAVARCTIEGLPLAADTGWLVLDLAVVAEAGMAGVQAAKVTADLIPLCHPLPVDQVRVDISVVGNQVEVVAVAATWARTGVEMEALVACTIAALAVVDGSDAADRAVIGSLVVLEKSGGRSGTWARSGPA